MANINMANKPMIKHDNTQLKAIFQSSNNDPYAKLLWESNRTPFSTIFYVNRTTDINKRFTFDPETKEWTTTSTSTYVRPENFTRDFEYGSVGYYTYSENANYNSLDWNGVNGGGSFYPSTTMPSSFWDICKAGLNPLAIWGYKDCSIGYYSDGNSQYVYNKTTNTFDTKVHRTTSGTIFKPNPSYMWALGDRLFHSNGSTHYEYKYDTTYDVWYWEPVTFSGMTNFSANAIWSDGDNTYYRVTNTYMRQLDPATLTWGAVFETADIGVNSIFTDGHSCYTKFTYDDVAQEYKYYEWDKYHKNWVQKTGSNMTLPQASSDIYIFNRDGTSLVANYGNWGTDQEPYKASMWATNGSAKDVGTTFYARFWPNENNSYKEINNE